MAPRRRPADAAGGFRRLALPLVLLALAAPAIGLGCSRERTAAPPPGPAAPASPAGDAAYREILRNQAGIALGPRELAALAAADAAWLSARMDALARRIAPDRSNDRPEAAAGDGWRPVFERLRDDHPPDAEAILAAYRREAERARAFVEARGLVTVPDGPLEVVRTPQAIPAGRYPFVGYIGYRLAVTVGAGARLRDHCRACIPPLAVHETYPGHHVVFLHQRSGSPVDDPAVLERAAEHLTNPFFHEAWGQYAEVLMLEAGYYDGEPERELGAWRSLLFRTTRARIDPLLHTGAMTAEEAVGELLPFLDRQTAEEEVARHLAAPAAKAAYYVGLLQVLALRDAVAGDDEAAFELRAFHDRLVRLPMPIPELARSRFGVELPNDLTPLERALPTRPAGDR